MKRKKSICLYFLFSIGIAWGTGIQAIAPTVDSLFKQIEANKNIEKMQMIMQGVSVHVAVQLAYKLILQSTFSIQEKMIISTSLLERHNIAEKDKKTIQNLQELMDNFVLKNISANSVIYRSPEETVLHWAAKLNEAYLAKVLLAHGAKINSLNQWKKTPLHYAAEWNSPDVVYVLLKHGANRNAKDENNKIPLQLAEQYGNKHVLEIFSKYQKE